MTIAEIVSNAIAGLALLVAGAALYLQRKDRQPELSVSALAPQMYAHMIGDGAGGFKDGPVEPAQIFSIKNTGLRGVKVRTVQARWLLGPPVDVRQAYRPLPVLEPDQQREYGVHISKIVPTPLTLTRRLLPFYRVEFLDEIGRCWTAGYRIVGTPGTKEELP